MLVLVLLYVLEYDVHSHNSDKRRGPTGIRIIFLVDLLFVACTSAIAQSCYFHVLLERKKERKGLVISCGRGIIIGNCPRIVSHLALSIR